MIVEKTIAQEVIEAYKETGLTPVQGYLLSENGSACALGALFYEDNDEWINGGDGDRWCRIEDIVRERYGWGDDDMFDFVRGFDYGLIFDNPPNCSSSSYHYSEGVEVAKAVKEEFGIPTREELGL